jgi:collagenase-like PrtC family protease
MGLKLDLLFNANCYGRHAVSQYLENQVVSVMHHLEDVAGGADAVTTTSPAVASTLKRNFPRVEVRASVNMRIGTVQAMRYLADLFDGFYVQRECNRDLARLGELKASADGEGKRLYLLANSGCLAFCPAQTFHDNLVAHESDVDETVNIPGFHPHLCWNLYADRANWPAILQACWIRPEDLHHYERLFDLVKLATRMHARPRSVLDAYGRRRWRGNLLELFEPGFAPAFAGWLLDNDRFPPDWFARTSACDRRCERCGYCAEVLDQVLVRADDGVAATIRTPNST